MNLTPSLKVWWFQTERIGSSRKGDTFKSSFFSRVSRNEKTTESVTPDLPTSWHFNLSPRLWAYEASSFFSLIVNFKPEPRAFFFIFSILSSSYSSLSLADTIPLSTSSSSSSPRRSGSSMAEKDFGTSEDEEEVEWSFEEIDWKRGLFPRLDWHVIAEKWKGLRRRPKEDGGSGCRRRLWIRCVDEEDGGCILTLPICVV